ncbi:MAG: hypothetical protein EOO48_12585 [Flavobacterium sp.]|nr:MAG: hypothetical protein EOO48_12585 [Flavobacterium sp.]
MKSKLLFFVLALGVMTLNSCSSGGDGGPNDSSAQFKDKWWYSPDNSTLDVYFNSNGTYESKFFFNGTTIPSNGEWEWVDESTKTFRVFNLQGNLTADYIGKVSDLTAHSLKLRSSLDDGATYSAPYSYIDTDN